MIRSCVTLMILGALAAEGSILRPTSANGQPPHTNHRVSARTLDAEVTAFTAREIAAHFANIKSISPPPERVMGALTIGDFSWGSFARTLAAQAEYSGDRTIAGKDSARAIAEMGLIESRQGGKSFAQLYSTLALRHFGTDLRKNAVWQSMNDSERAEWHSLLDPTRFYDAKKRAVIDLPENYLGVAARVAAMSYKLGVLKDKAFLDSVVERAAEQFVKGAVYADDSPPTGRYDRYSNEYARFCWDAAVIAGREDIKEKLKPSLRRQMRLWWDLVSPSGYGYNWGRSQGLVSYLDTVEIAAFLGENPEFRPAPLSDIAALYNQAWLWLQADYLKDRHLFNVFGYGRGNYAYINRNREWQQTGVGLGKLIIANHSFMRAMEKEGVAQFPSTPNLPDVSRFEYFAKTADKVEGVWLFRKGKLQFALPITVGTVPGVTDYLPAPFGLPGFAAPVEAIYPSYVPFLMLDDGNEYTAGDSSDVISPASDGRSLKITNTKWAKIGSKSGARFENGLKSEVEFRIDGGKLIRRETVTALRDINIKTWRFAFPSTASSSSETYQNGRQIFFLNGREGKLTVAFRVIDGTKIRVVATSDGKLGKGVLGAIPIHLVAETENIKLASGQRLSWEISVEPGADARTGN